MEEYIGSYGGGCYAGKSPPRGGFKVKNKRRVTFRGGQNSKKKKRGREKIALKKGRRGFTSKYAQCRRLNTPITRRNDEGTPW